MPFLSHLVYGIFIIAAQTSWYLIHLSPPLPDTGLKPMEIMNNFQGLSPFDKEGRCMIQVASSMGGDDFVDKEMDGLVEGQEKLWGRGPEGNWGELRNKLRFVSQKTFVEDLDIWAVWLCYLALTLLMAWRPLQGDAGTWQKVTDDKIPTFQGLGV